MPEIGIGGASRLRPSHTTVRTGPYTAVREVELTRFEHYLTRVGRAFGFIHRREHSHVFPQRLPGFTLRRRSEVQSQLDPQPLVVLETQFNLPLFPFGASVLVSCAP